MVGLGLGVGIGLSLYFCTVMLIQDKQNMLIQEHLLAKSQRPFLIIFLDCCLV